MIHSLEFWDFIVNSLATLLAAIAILVYILFWYREKTSDDYDVFDSMYMELLKLGMEYPSFRNPDITNTYQHSLNGDEKVRYELYAFMCWNFCETIFDKGDKKLMNTWSVIIESESQLHAKWFEQAENRKRFKDSFCVYIFKNQLQSS